MYSSTCACISVDHAAAYQSPYKKRNANAPGVFVAVQGRFICFEDIKPRLEDLDDFSSFVSVIEIHRGIHIHFVGLKHPRRCCS